MKKILLLAFSVGFALISCKQNPNPSSQNNLNQIRKDKIDPALEKGSTNDFATKAAIGTMMEIESSAIMIKRTENRDIQNLATIMVRDHLMAQRELKAIAKQNKISIPQRLPDDKKAILSRLDSLKNDERNHFYAQLMVKEHENAVSLFRAASTNEAQPALANFARKKLPTLEHHLMEAQHNYKIMRIIKGDKDGMPLKISRDEATAH
ncbi:MAG: DUF4142 domain-containing protein [Pedobacter sp.]|uniref:DUF4142 domain-containing protein n=1 Tax=Pedobacter sp. TaxID=1411316 RepID=UPI00280A3F57|nr:DUF4142 domain-containing protein [Pedobacter sp.]MDQ8004939.1 DUF4142 domain-containing protein [Pedobacter sp.]